MICMKTWHLIGILLTFIALSGCLLPQEKHPWEGMSTGTNLPAGCLFVIPIDINTTVASNLTNFPAMVSMNTSNASIFNSTTCANLAFYESTNTTTLPYDLDAVALCGNSSFNATYWVGGNYTANATTRIYACINSLTTASGENKTAVWRNANYVGVWHGDGNSTLIDAAGYSNLTRRNTNSYSVLNSTATGWTAYLPMASGQGWNTSTAVGLPTGNNSHSEYVKIYLTGWKGSQSNNYGRFFTYGTLTTGEWNLYVANYAATQMESALSTGEKVADIGVISTGAWSWVGADFNTTREFIWKRTTAATPTISSAMAYTNTGMQSTGAFMDVGSIEDYAAGYYIGGYIDELRIRNQSSTADWRTAEYAQTASVGGVQQYVAPLTVNYTTGITALQFRPTHAFATNVQPVNQSAGVPLFNVTTGAAGTYLINASQTPTIAGFIVKCAPNYNQTGLITLNATTQWITNVTYPASQGIWCWADFNNPNPRSASYNITVVQG